MSMDATFPSSFTDSSYRLAAPMVCSVSLAGLQNPGISSFFSRPSMFRNIWSVTRRLRRLRQVVFYK